MLRNLLNLAVFAAGLAAVCWIGAGYVGSNPLGTTVTLVIAACYVAGALELHRYRQATSTLQGAVAELSSPPASLADWLAALHPSLRNAVRLRVEGERVAMPVPALTPYLVGLLVLLGMLGTLLGMMATLRGTGLALESATDLQAIRGSLAAPVKGLGFAFGTSIAGVASSAMLGLLSALCRRERLLVTQQLDARIATTLRVHSQAHQREEAFHLLQQQTAQMPVLAERLQAMMVAIEQQNQAASERQLASHEAFHARTEVAYARLASSVEASLKESVAEGARSASAALQPVVEATMAGLTREAGALHDNVSKAVQQQLTGLSTGFETTTRTVAGIWTDAIAEQRRSNEALAQDLQGSQQRFTETFEQHAAGLLDGVSARLDAAASGATAAWNDALTHWNGAIAEQRRSNEALAQDLHASQQRFTQTFEQHAAGLLDGVSARLDAAASGATAAWNDALAQQQAANQALVADQQQALTTAATAFTEQAATLVGHMQQSQATLQSTLESRDQERLAAWTDSFGVMTASVNTQWEQTAAQTATRQQEICDALANTAGEMSTQLQTHAGATIAEISRLVDAASEAPRVAAEVVAELRQKLSDSMVRDTAMLEERSRLLATLETLLDAVNHASTEQRTAVDALVNTSAGLLDRVSTRFTAHVEAETGKLGDVAAQLTGSAVEVASLGEAFGSAVQLFGQSNEALMERLELIAAALDKSLARSDEQLAYYVAQAREVIDLSMLSQRQIIEELQQSASQQATAAVETA